MENKIPEIITYPRKRCEEHQNIYAHHHLPCPYPNCINGIDSDKFIDKTLSRNFNENDVYDFSSRYIRKHWVGINGDKKYIWIQEDEPFLFNSNIIYDEVFKFIQSKASERIYHYTKLDALYKILESNELWLTEWKCTNDKIEIKHGLQLANEFNKDNLDLEQIINKNNYFITSFSYEINKKTLFADYADQGRGVAIEFDTNFYDNPRKSFWYKNAEFTKLMPVIYDEETQKKILQYAFYIYEVSKQWLNDSKDFYNFNHKLISKKKRKNKIQQYFLTTLAEIISFFKHPSFEDERETRWLYRYDKKFIKKQKFSNIKMKNFNGKNYYTSNDIHNMSVEKAYNFQNTEYDINLPIKSIILGSRMENKKEMIDEIKNQCKKYGFDDVEIKVSDLPYQ